MATAAHRYATLSDVKAALGITDTTSDDDLVAVIDGVSRAIDEYCRRWFFPVIQERYFATEDAAEVRIPGLDLLDLSRIDLDMDDDGTYEEAWTTSTYWSLLPYNARASIPARPYWAIRVPARNANAFPVGLERAIKVTGTWGYYDERVATTTASASIAAGDATIALANASTLLSRGQAIRIGTEQMRVETISGANVGVTRGTNGTTAASHASGASVETYAYPVVQDAVAHQSVLAYRQRNHPYGTVGVGDVTTEPRVMTAAGLHPFVRSMLAPYRLQVAGR